MLRATWGARKKKEKKRSRRKENKTALSRNTAFARPRESTPTKVDGRDFAVTRRTRRASASWRRAHFRGRVRASSSDERGFRAREKSTDELTLLVRIPTLVLVVFERPPRVA